jgi:hypothetical protein
MVPGGPATRGPIIGHGGEVLDELRAEPALGRDPQRPVIVRLPVAWPLLMLKLPDADSASLFAALGWLLPPLMHSAVPATLIFTEFRLLPSSIVLLTRENALTPTADEIQ